MLYLFTFIYTYFLYHLFLQYFMRIINLHLLHLFNILTNHSSYSSLFYYTISLACVIILDRCVIRVKKFKNFVHKFFRRGNYAFSCPSHAKSTVLTAVHDGRHHDGIVTLSWGTCSSINFSDTVRESILTVHHFSLRGVAKLRRFFVKIVKVLRY